MRCLPPLALIPALLIVAPTAPAQVYKGVDADGDVVAQTPVAHVHLRPPSSENGRP